MSANRPDPRPACVALYLAGFEASSRELEWEDGQLWVRECRLGSGDLHRIPWQAHDAPTEAAWRRLRGAADAVDFWQWPSTPTPPGEDCRWRIALQWGAQRRTVAGALDLHPALRAVVEAILALRTQPLADYPQAFRLRCDWPGGEEHFGWDGRHLAFASFEPRPRILEGQRVPLSAWKEIAPLLAAGQPVLNPVRAEGESFLIEPLHAEVPCPAREVPAPLRHELRWRLKGLLPADCRLEGVPGTGLAVRH